MKKMFDQALELARTNPLRFGAWIVAGLVLFFAGVVIGDGMGIQLYLFTH